MSGTEQSLLPITAAMFPCPACGASAVGTIDTLVCRWSTGADGEVTDWQGNDLDTQETLYRDGRPVLCWSVRAATTTRTRTSRLR